MTKEKKSLWQRIKNFASGTTPAEEAFYEFVENGELEDEIVLGEEISVPEETHEDVSSRAIRLAGEEEEKQRLAELAKEQADRAEAASRCARIDAALIALNGEALRLQEESALSQQQAAKALSLLNEAESLAAAAAGEYEAAREEEAAVLKAGEEKITALTAEWEIRLAALREKTAGLEQELERMQASKEAADAALHEKELALENAEAEQRRLSVESADQLARAEAAQAECRNALEVAGKRIALLEARIDRDQQEFDQAEGALTAAAASVDQAGEAVALVKGEIADVEQQQAAAAAALDEENNKTLAALEEEKLAQIRETDACRERAEAAERAAAAAERELASADEALRNLILDKENAEYTAKAEMQQVNDAIDAAKQLVLESKAAYTEAQRAAEEVSARAMQANAIAKRARAQADKAAAETNDARIAEETARKLKTDAVAAKGTDETASLLLGKAEMVLDATIEKAAKLLEEKLAAQNDLEEKAAAREQEAESAAAESARINSDVDAKITRWLDAEEELVRATAQAEEEKQAVERRLLETKSRLDDAIAQSEQILARAKEERRLAAAAVEDAVALVKQGENRLHDAGNRLSAGIAACDAAKNELEQDQKEAMSRAMDKLAAAERHQQAAENTHARLKLEQEERSRTFSVTLEEYGKERERLREEQQARADELDRAEQSGAALEQSYKDALAYLRERIDGYKEDLSTARTQAEAEGNALAECEQAVAAVKGELTQTEVNCAAELEQARNEAKAALEPKSRLAADLRVRAEAAAAALPIRRSEAEEAVQTASSRFNARLAALNAVARKKAEKEIAVMQENSIDLYLSADHAEAELKQVEAAFAEASARADQLRGEEAAITANAADNTLRIEAENNAAVLALENELAGIAVKTGEEEEAVRRGEADLQKAKDVLAQAESAVILLAEEKEALIRDTDAEEEQLKQKYDADIRKAEEELAAETDRLTRAELDAAQRAAEEDEARAAFDASDRTAGNLRLAEADAPVRSLERITALKNSHRNVVNCARRDLSAKESEQEKLRIAYAAAEERAVLADAAAEEAEAAALRLEKEAAEIKERADRELAAISSRAAALREDAGEKENRFRELEQTLSDSSRLMEAAEGKVRDAELVAAKALSELQAALAAQETAASLARQAASTFERMDPATADIMRRASEDLFNAAENAGALVQEKENAHRDTEAALEAARGDLDALKKNLGSAPEQMEQARALWQSAEQAYRDHRAEGEQKAAEINADLERILPKAEAEADAAREKAIIAREEAADSKDNFRELEVKLAEITAAVRSAAKELAAAESAEKEAVGKAEAEAAQELSEKQEARQNGDLHLEACRAALEQAAAAALRTRKDAEAIREQHRAAVTAHEAKAYDLSRDYQQASAMLESRREDMLRREAEGIAALEAAKKQLAAAEEYLAEHRADLTALVNDNSAKEGEIRLLGLKKEQLLRATEEEKLRSLGSCTIARLAAEEEVSRIEGELVQKRTVWTHAAKRTADVEAAMSQVRQKLEQLTAEAVKQGWSLNAEGTESTVEEV